MVKVREDQPQHFDGSVDLGAWLNRLQERYGVGDTDSLREACELARQAELHALQRSLHQSAEENSLANGKRVFPNRTGNGGDPCRAETGHGYPGCSRPLSSCP